MTQAQTLLSCSTLNSYLKTLQSETLSELYNHPATCLAVFRELPDLAKQFVMRLFYVEQAVPQAVVLSWVNQASYGEKAKESSTALTELGIWKDTAMPGGTFLFLIKFLYILLSSDAGSGLAIAILANLEAKSFLSILSNELISILAPISSDISASLLLGLRHTVSTFSLGMKAWILDKTFRTNLKVVLVGG